MKKLKDENLEIFEEIQFEKMEKANKTWEKILSNTNLSKNDYLDMMERNFKERIKILKRNNLKILYYTLDYIFLINSLSF